MVFTQRPPRLLSRDTRRPPTTNNALTLLIVPLIPSS